MRGKRAGPGRPPSRPLDCPPASCSDHTGHGRSPLRDPRMAERALHSGRRRRRHMKGGRGCHTPSNTLHPGPSTMQFGGVPKSQLPLGVEGGTTHLGPSFHSSHLSEGPPNPWNSRAPWCHGRQGNDWQGHRTCRGCTPRPAQRGRHGGKGLPATLPDAA